MKGIHTIKTPGLELQEILLLKRILPGLLFGIPSLAVVDSEGESYCLCTFC